MSDPGIPDDVYADIGSQPDLIKEWVTNEEFRTGVLNAEDPGSYVRSYGGRNFRMSPETSEWIQGRIRFHGVEKLLGPHDIQSF